MAMTALDDLVDALETAQRSVFRLEARQDYPDDELWQAHQRGEWWEQSADLTDWCSLVSATVDRGVTWTRARVVTEPWTPYTRWEIEQHYPHNLTAGEDIRLVRASEPWATVDFWLVDATRAWLLRYDDGSMTVTEAVPELLLPAIRTWRDRALEVATPLKAPVSR